MQPDHAQQPQQAQQAQRDKADLAQLMRLVLKQQNLIEDLQQQVAGLQAAVCRLDATLPGCGSSSGGSKGGRPRQRHEAGKGV